jgi:hypothetical protein
MQMLAQTNTRRGNLSFYLGGKAPSDPEKGAEYGRGASNDQIRYGHRTIKH